MMPDSTTTNLAKYDLAVTRVFGAPVERVWRAWSEPEEVMRWWGPQGFTSPSCRMAFHEGGTTLVHMHSPDYGDLYNTWTYTRIVPWERIEFVQHFADAGGNRLDPAAIGLPPDIPSAVPHVVTFRALSDGHTEMTAAEFGYPTEQIAALSLAGLEQCLDKMAASINP